MAYGEHVRVMCPLDFCQGLLALLHHMVPLPPSPHRMQLLDPANWREAVAKSWELQGELLLLLLLLKVELTSGNCRQGLLRVRGKVCLGGHNSSCVEPLNRAPQQASVVSGRIP